MADKAEIKIDTTEAMRKIKDLQKEVRETLKIIPIQITCNESDVIIFTHPKTLSDMAYEHVKKAANEMFKGTKVIILEEGMRITSCVRQESLGVGEEHH